MDQKIALKKYIYQNGVIPNIGPKQTSMGISTSKSRPFTSIQDQIVPSVYSSVVCHRRVISKPRVYICSQTENDAVTHTRLVVTSSRWPCRRHFRFSIPSKRAGDEVRITPRTGHLQKLKGQLRGLACVWSPPCLPHQQGYLPRPEVATILDLIRGSINLQIWKKRVKNRLL